MKKQITQLLIGATLALGGHYTIEKFTVELGFMGKMEGLLILG